jgi:hypothetical protein
MGQGSTKPLTEMSSTNFSRIEERPALMADNFTAHVWADCIENVGTSSSHNPMGLHGLLEEWLYFFFTVIIMHRSYHLFLY